MAMPTKRELRACAAEALSKRGYRPRFKTGPGRPEGALLELNKGAKSWSCSVRTTTDRWIAFPWKEGGGWKTLDDVDIVVVSAVDDATTPGSVDVYFIPAKFVREAFEASRKARLKAGNIVRENWGMWVALDPHEGDSPAKVGSGFIAHAEWHE